METSTYLFRSRRAKRKNNQVFSRKMETRKSSGGNISLDSLENDFQQITTLKEDVSKINVETILVPFYENDVLMKIPKGHTKTQTTQEYSSKTKKVVQTTTSYLVNKNRDSKKKGSYLEMFRKQFIPRPIEKKKEEQEIRSMSPEFGDTERESFNEDAQEPPTEFYNTECYNELYYQKLLDHETEKYFDDSLDEAQLCELDTVKNKSQEILEDNLKSVSEVTQDRRHTRRATVEPIAHVKLGGLGPDIEKIRPRLERARSLQRYSEKVRMENRLKIYKRSLQADIDKKAERESSSKRQSPAKEKTMDESISYLVNKNLPQKTPKANQEHCYKSKSANVQKARDREREKEKQQLREKSITRNVEQENETERMSYRQSKSNKPHDNTRARRRLDDNTTNGRVKSSGRSRAVNTETTPTQIPPMQISFLVNVDGLRPSSALQRLEEKHMMYQEKVKTFAVDKNE